MDVPLLNIHVSQRVNLGGYNHADVSVGVSKLPFDATEADIERALETGDVAIRMILGRVREEVARIRCEDAYPPVKPTAPMAVDLSAFDATSDEETADEVDPFDDPGSQPDPASIRTNVETPILDALQRLADGEDAEAGRLQAMAEEVFEGEQPFGGDLAEIAMPSDAREEPSPIAIPTAADVSITIDVFGVPAPMPTREDFLEQITGSDGGQMKALNTALSEGGHKDAFRHLACEAIVDAWFAARWGEETNAPRRITSLYQLSKGEASICLEVLNSDALDSLRLQTAVGYRAAARAQEAGQSALL